MGVGNQSDIYYWHNPKDNKEYPTIMIKGKKARLRAGIIILNNKNEILLGEEDQQPGQFGLPGGAIDRGETPAEAAKREAEEEVHLELKDVEYSDIDYCEYYDNVFSWVKENVPEKEWWYHYYTCLCIGYVKDRYVKDVAAEDQDATMLHTAKFYKIKDVIDDPSFMLEWKQVLKKYGIINTLTEASKEKTLYGYDGPVYIFGKVQPDLAHLKTLAVSTNAAKRNFIAQLAKKYNLVVRRGVSITLDEDSIYEIFTIKKYEPIERGKCPECGMDLNDAGECPLCDLGDESVLDT